MSGFDKYAFGANIVLESDSYVKAEEKIRKHLNLRKRHNIRTDDFYHRDNILWKECQFLFLLQYVEFLTAEFVGQLYSMRLIQDSWIEELRNHKSIDVERREKAYRMFSPLALLGLRGYSLGEMINRLISKTEGFERKGEIVGELSTFNNCRVDFIHHSLNHTVDIHERLKEGFSSGKRIINVYEEWTSSIESTNGER